MHYIAYTILVSCGFVPIWVWFGCVVNEGIEKLNFMVYFFTSAEFPKSNFYSFYLKGLYCDVFYSCLKK
jgi:hypothetical protein